MNADEANPFLLEHSSDGTSNLFVGGGFHNATPGDEISGGESIETEDGTANEFSVPSLLLQNGSLFITIEQTKTLGGEPVEGGEREVTAITFFFDRSDMQSTVAINLEDVKRHLELVIG